MNDPTSPSELRRHAADGDYELASLLRATLQAVAATTPKTVGRVVKREEPRLRLVGVAAATVVLAGTAGVIAVTTRDGDTTDRAAVTRSVPVVAPAIDSGWLSLPPDTPGYRIIESLNYPPLQNWGGLLLDDRGSFVRLEAATTPFDTVGFDTESRQIGPYQVDHVAGENPTLGVYDFVAGCVALNVVADTHGAPWPDNVVGLIEGISAQAGDVTVDLPAGWSSLGAARWGASNATTFAIDINGVAQQLLLRQTSQTPVGVVLWDPAARLTSVNHLPAWLTASGNGPLTITFESAGNTVELTGQLGENELINVAEQLGPYGFDGATVTAEPVDSQVEAVDTTLEELDCDPLITVIDTTTPAQTRASPPETSPS